MTLGKTNTLPWLFGRPKSSYIAAGAGDNGMLSCAEQSKPGAHDAMASDGGSGALTRRSLAKRNNTTSTASPILTLSRPLGPIAQYMNPRQMKTKSTTLPSISILITILDECMPGKIRAVFA
jgi:hypothetical protein